MVTPMVQNVLPHRDPMVTPMVQNVHPHLAVRQVGRNLPNEPPIGSITPKGIPRTKILHIRWVQRPLRPYHALSTAHDARYWQRRVVVQSIPRQPTRAGPLMVSSPTSQLC
ncbi:hypothetical protein AAG906_019423 [Vitis piasezkii]